MDIKLEYFLQRKLKSEGMSIAKLARETKIPKSSLGEWAQGRFPSAKSAGHLLSLSNFFGVSLEELLFNVKSTKDSSAILMETTFVDDGRKYRMTIERLEV